jgi:hypothetical protein
MLVVQVQRLIDTLVSSEGGDLPEGLTMDLVAVDRARKRKAAHLAPQNIAVEVQ